jgi:hypothetical protein
VLVGVAVGVAVGVGVADEGVGVGVHKNSITTPFNISVLVLPDEYIEEST